jgi:hypothetical protein
MIITVLGVAFLPTKNPQGAACGFGEISVNAAAPAGPEAGKIPYKIG